MHLYVKGRDFDPTTATISCWLPFKNTERSTCPWEKHSRGHSIGPSHVDETIPSTLALV